MKNKTDLQLLRYWRNTLADAARVEIPVDQTIHQPNAEVDFQKGTVTPAQASRLVEAAERRLNESKSRSGKKDKDWEYLQETPVLIAPFRVSPLPEYTKLSGEAGIFYPFWVRAVLSKDGMLKADEDTFPYIPRTHLEPQVNQNVNFTFSDVDKVDQAFAKPFAGAESWTLYWNYIQEAFLSITGMQLEQYAVDNFIPTYQATIVVNETLTGAADGIIQLYDYLIHNKETPALLERLCKKGYESLSPLLPVDAFEKASARHAGQMGFEYPLSVSQRKSLYHFNTTGPGDILAINGPPGTGKTTLLQSIVANEVVKRAIEGAEPAVILACSTNNQAVTNIIDSFSNVKQKQGLLYERWLPQLAGFGLYLPKQVQNVAKDIPYIKRLQGRLSGPHIEKENSAYIAGAEKHFINCFENYTGRQQPSLKAIVDDLQTTLKTKQQQLDEGIRIWQQYKTIAALIDRLQPEDADQLFSQNGLNEQQLAHIEASIKELEAAVSDYLDKESFWIKLFSFLRFVKEKRAFRLKQLFQDCPVAYNAVAFYKISTFHPFFDERLQLTKQIKQLNKDWLAWKAANKIKGNPPVNDAGFKAAEQNRQAFFYDELEMGLKYDLFYLATHYWEGRWLMETSNALAEDRLGKNGIEHAKGRWRRFAMLTPCLVSTFYMAPKFFTYSKFIKKAASKNVYETPPLSDFIDLLIVDEAGQVSPEIGAASFALAKQSLVVGDTLQIEPVWNVPKKVDHANLQRYGVIATTDDTTAIDDFLQKGFLSSSGSIMKLAQKSSQYHLYPAAERGMLLTEHRRCFNEIIEYCNRLAYSGLLEPKKGPAKNTLFPPMQFINTAGVSKAAGTSRENPEEAIKIAEWIKLYKAQMLTHYQNTENAEALKERRQAKKLYLGDIIGIITPFTGQKSMLKTTFRRLGIDISGLTIGTVHALQGAERPVILFSSTYGVNDIDKGYFFDAGVNMLNVAVSRAKEAFVFFGSEGNFKGKGNSPSVQLYNHIQALQR